jgi:hypothetical protein
VELAVFRGREKACETPAEYRALGLSHYTKMRGDCAIFGDVKIIGPAVDMTTQSPYISNYDDGPSFATNAAYLSRALEENDDCKI